MVGIERKFFAYLDEMQEAAIILPISYHGGFSESFLIYDGQHSVPLEINKKVEIDDAFKYICTISFEPMFGKTYWIIDHHGGQTDLQIGAVIRTNQFDTKFFYQGRDLGIRYTENQTDFKLWAPTATQVLLKLEAPDSSDSEVAEMLREGNGTWSVTIKKNLEYWHYTYLVCVNLEWRESVDPYAVATTVNGILGVVVDLAKVRVPKPNISTLEHPVDAVIYETHIRDLSIHPLSGIHNKGKYLGAAEINTVGKDGKPTGLSYIKSLGVTHIEFLPFHDFAGVNELIESGEYNWGYNPLHFNVPDGSYSSDPRNPYSRISDLKNMISGIQKYGLRVIMDAVYNHVYIREQSAFEKIVPGYFFRHDEFGMPSNGTGVGNDIASERLMARKFIVDSVRFWLEEYHVDGFRFDLMGILDVETMNEVRRTADEICPDAIIIGEGWDLNTPLESEKKASIRNQAKLPRIGQFNDWFRDSVKGNTFNLYDKGYALGNDYYLESAKQVMAGSIGLEKPDNGIFQEPGQSVNYVESHDNHTMWDKLQACHQEFSDVTRMRYHRLATSMSILAQGIPFLHSGQEFFRTKKGIGNSYRSSDEVNQIDWERKIHFEEHVEYISGIIKIRKHFDCFRLRSAEEIRSKMKMLALPPPLIGYTLAAQMGEWCELLVLINSSQVSHRIQLPEGNWHIITDGLHSFDDPISVQQVSHYEIAPISLHVLAKN